MSNKTEQFTPGPWGAEFIKWHKGAPTTGILIRSLKTDIVSLNVTTSAQIVPKTSEWFNEDFHMDTIEAEANANLIAAAPDMYEALKQLINDLDFNKDNIHGANGSYNKAKAALKKANPQQ
jgi:hypothetical protein